MTKEFVDIAELLLKSSAAAGAVIAFVIGYQRYKEGQDWQKAQVLLGLIDSFKSDKLIQAACLMLDWDQRTIEFGNGRRVPFKNSMLVNALKVVFMDESKSVTLDKMLTDVEDKVGDGFSPDESAIRDCFDQFFDFFDKVNAFRRKNLIQMSDLTYFNYWFELVRAIGKNKGDEEIQRTLDRYIETYNFRGFQELSRQNIGGVAG